MTALDLFRAGKNTYEIAAIYGVREAFVCSVIHRLREAEFIGITVGEAINLLTAETDTADKRIRRPELVAD